MRGRSERGAIDMAKKWTVYKITASEGDYIGVTSRDPRFRLYENRYRRGIEGPVVVIAEFETRDEAFLLERELVPDLNQGLNRCVGEENLHKCVQRVCASKA